MLHADYLFAASFELSESLDLQRERPLKLSRQRAICVQLLDGFGSLIRPSISIASACVTAIWVASMAAISFSGRVPSTAASAALT